MTQALDDTRTTTIVSEETSDNPEDSAHIVLVPPAIKQLYPDMTPQAYVMDARINGYAITALCGYTWVPQKMATGLPICEKCKAIYSNDPNGFGDRDRLPDE